MTNPISLHTECCTYYCVKRYPTCIGACIGCEDDFRRRATPRKCAIRAGLDLALMTHPSRGMGCPLNARKIRTGYE